MARVSGACEKRGARLAGGAVGVPGGHEEGEDGGGRPSRESDAVDDHLLRRCKAGEGAEGGQRRGAPATLINLSGDQHRIPAPPHGRTSRGGWHLEDISSSRGHLEGISWRGAWAPRCSSSRSAAPSSSRACAGAGPRRRRARAPPRSRTPPLRRRRCCSTPLGGGGAWDGQRGECEGEPIPLSHAPRRPPLPSEAGRCLTTQGCVLLDGCERGRGACEAVSWGKAHSSRVASGCSTCESFHGVDRAGE